MNERYYCPDCKNELEVTNACGSESYFCNHCKKLISRTKIVSQTEMALKEENNSDEKK